MMHTNGVGGPSDRPLPSNAVRSRNRNRNNIAWVDVETDGLDAHDGHLLEIAVVVTDAELNILDEEGFHAVVKYTLSEKSLMILNAAPVVVEMHQKTWLWDKLTSDEALELAEVDKYLSKYLKTFGEPKTMPVAGNTVRLDMNFMDRHLPQVAGFLDYHMRDVSTVAGLASDWYDLPWFEKTNDHTAKHDIRESIRELKHYREAIFKTVGEADLMMQLHERDRWIAERDAKLKALTEAVSETEYVRNGVCLLCGDGVLASGEHVDPGRHSAEVERITSGMGEQWEYAVHVKSEEPDEAAIAVGVDSLEDALDVAERTRKLYGHHHGYWVVSRRRRAGEWGRC